MTLRGAPARRRGRAGVLAWAISLAALALSVWLLWAALRPQPETAPGAPPPRALAPAATAPTPGDSQEVTKEEQRALEEVLRRKGGGARQ